MYLPDPIPAYFLLPLGDFVKKYDCEAILNTMFELDPALGDFTSVPAIERIRVFGLSLVQAVSTGVLTTARHNNSEIYTKAQTELLAASSLLLNSEVLASSREQSGVKLVVSTPQGKKLIVAKRLLITIPPKLDIMTPFDLSRQEQSVFSKLIDVGYYTSVMKNAGIPDNVGSSTMPKTRHTTSPFSQKDTMFRRRQRQGFTKPCMALLEVQRRTRCLMTR